MTYGIGSAPKTVTFDGATTGPTATAATGRYGAMEVTLGTADRAPAPQTGFGDKVKAFFSSLGSGIASFFTAIKDAFVSLGERIGGAGAAARAAPAHDAGPPASDAACDELYDAVKQDCAKLNDMPQFMRNQVFHSINQERGHFSEIAKAFVAGSSDKPASVFTYDGSVSLARAQAEKDGVHFAEPKAKVREAVVERAAQNFEAFLSEMIGGTDPEAIREKADQVPQALCDLLATARRALEDHLAENNLSDSDTAARARTSLDGKILGNRVLGPALAASRGEMSADSTKATNVRQMLQLLPQVYSSNLDKSVEGPAIRAAMEHSVDDWREAFHTFADHVAARGAAAADAASQRA